MRSISSFVRATVAFGLFPLPCFLSFRRLDLRTFHETLNSSSLRILIGAALLDSLNAGFEKGTLSISQRRGVISLIPKDEFCILKDITSELRG